jgi:hypothetical protein
MAPVVEALDGRRRDSTVYPLDLAIGGLLVRLGELVLMLFASQILYKRICGVTVAQSFGRQDAIVGPYCVDAAGHGFQQVFQELSLRSPVSLVDPLGDSELARAVDGLQQVELACGSLHLGDSRRDSAFLMLFASSWTAAELYPEG